MACGDELDLYRVARSAFGILMARKASPNDHRQVDLESQGLIIVTREDAQLGEVPAFARFVIQPNLSTSYQQEKYAVHTKSLGMFVDNIRSGQIERPKRMGEQILSFLDILTSSHPT